MATERRIVICLETKNQSEIKTALEYWDIDVEGRVRGTVKKLADRIQEPQYKISAIVRNYATAFDLDIRCHTCGQPRRLASRSKIPNTTWTTAKHPAKYYCDHCEFIVKHGNQRTIEQDMRRDTEDQPKSIYHELARSIILTEAKKCVAVDYSSLRYFDALLLYSIMLSSPYAVTDGWVGNARHMKLCPSGKLLGTYLGSLFDKGILLFNPDTPLYAIDPESKSHKGFAYYPIRVSWRLAPPKNSHSFRRVFQLVRAIVDSRTEHPEFQKAVLRLWWDLGLDDGIDYLERQLNRYSLSGFYSGGKMEEAVIQAVGHFSIPQARNLLWRTAKNTAAVPFRRDFTRLDARNAIPRDVMRATDRAWANRSAVKPYCMKWDEQEAMLTTLLFDRILKTGIEGFKTLTGGYE